MNDYVPELEYEGYNVDVVLWRHGPEGITHPEQLRDYLIYNYYENGVPYFHLLFIGNLPVAYFVISDNMGEHVFPFDVFYSELDGEWTEYEDDEYWPVYDGHAGGNIIYPDIPVGRWYVSTLTYGFYEQEYLVETYIAKNLAYRQGNMTDPPPALALNYFDEPNGPVNSWMVEEVLEDSYGEGNVITVDDPWTTWDTDYEYRIDGLGDPDQGFEWVGLSAHGDVIDNSFGRPDRSTSYTYYYEVINIEPWALFYGNHGCLTHRYTGDETQPYDYIGGWYVFVPTCEWGLGSIGHTDGVPFGGPGNPNTLVWDDLHAAIGTGETLGEGLRQEIWGVDYTDGYGWSPMARVLVGDPTLKISQFMGGYVTSNSGDLGTGLYPILKLSNVGPNPADKSVTIDYETYITSAPVRIKVYDLAGRRVRDITLSEPKGEFTWDLTDDHGARVAPGVYVIRLEGGGASVVKKVVVLR